MRTVLRAMLCGLFCAVAVACASSEPESPALIYTVGGCVEEADAVRAATAGDVLIVGEGGAIHMEHRLTYVCCAELVLTVEQEGNTIRLVESNVGEICRCLCAYDVEADVSGLEPGVYDVQVWGVEYQDVHAPELLGQASIAL